ncbi:phage late control D family protein [Roseibium sp. MB-4]
MSLSRPYVEVIGPTQRNLVPFWGSDLIGVRVTDHAGYESDEAVLRFSDRSKDVPPKGTLYTIAAAYDRTRPPMLGAYSFSHVRFTGDPENGHVKEIVCRAADFIEKMKEASSKHYDTENGFGTAGKIFRDLAKNAGVPAVVAPALENIEIPYRLRWRQSPLDFATDLADEIGGILKPQAGKLVVMERGAGQSASGRTLPPILMRHDPSFEYEVEIEERPAHSAIEGGWFDPKTGRSKAERSSAGNRQGGLAAVLHPFASEVEARRGSSAFAQQLARYTGTGSFTGPGQPQALAGAPFIPSGYGSAIDSIPWEAETVIHDIVPDDGWVMTVDVETQEKAA